MQVGHFKIEGNEISYYFLTGDLARDSFLGSDTLANSSPLPIDLPLSETPGIEKTGGKVEDDVT
jgi:hypothetical protein